MPDVTDAPTPAPTPAATPAPTPAESAIRKLRPFQQLKKAAADAIFGGRKLQEAEAGAGAGDELIEAVAEGVTEAFAGAETDDVGEYEEEYEVAPEGDVVKMTSSFVVLDGKNALDQGEANAFVKAVRETPVGIAAAPKKDEAAESEAVAAADYAPMGVPDGSSSLPGGVKPAYAAVNGDVYCNMCGFKEGILDYEIVGAAGDQCNPMEDTPCTLDGVQVMGADGQAGSLPGWATNAGKLFDADAGKLTNQLNTDVVTATMRVGCSADDAVPELCVQPSDLKRAIESSLGTDCARVNVARTNQEKHPDLAGAMPSNAGAALAGSANTDVFDVSFTSYDAACTAAASQWVQDFQPEQLNEHLDAITPESVSMDQAAAEYLTTHTVKGMTFPQASTAAFDAVVSTMRTGVTPSVLVSGADASAAQMALPSFAPGSAGTMSMTGFLKNKPVTFEMASKCSALGAAKLQVPGAASSGIDAVPVGVFTPSATGANNVPFTVPADLPAGTYSMRATQSGFSFCSQPFEVK